MKCLTKNELREVLIDDVKPGPYQPRESFDNQALEELAASFDEVGMLQPIVVRPHGRGYQIIVGERRWQAAKARGDKTIQMVVRDVDDRTARLYSLVENLHRENLSSSEEEKAIYQLWKKHYEKDKSMAQMSRDLGKSHSFVSDHVNAHLRRNELDVGHGDAARITTHDIRATKGMDKQTAQELLKAKVEGKVEPAQLDKLIPSIRRATPERRKEIVREVIKAGKLKQKYDEDLAEASVAYADGYEGPTKVVRSADSKRTERFTDLREQVRWWGKEEFMQIDDIKLRNKAVEAIGDAGDYLTRLASMLRKEDWYGKSADGMPPLTEVEVCAR